MFYLKNIELNNFRCYKATKFGFSDNINIFVGQNAVGKTSIIEAINFLGLCKSFRTSNDGELMKEKEEYFFVKGKIENNDIETTVVISASQNGKKVVVNNKTYKNLSEYLGFINVVSFSPEDIKLVKGEPKARRRFLDLNIGQVDREYLLKSIEYNKILKERNELLKNINIIPHSQELLKVYTDKLGELGVVIIEKRKKFINDIKAYINAKAKIISSGKENVDIIYTPSAKENFKTELKRCLNKDIEAKTTTIGPHRDDIVFEINGLNASIYGSQGQQRTISLATKLGLAEYIKEMKKNLIILLDDVFGELDQERQNELLKVVNSSVQVFITTTSVQNISPDVLAQSKIIEVRREG